MALAAADPHVHAAAAAAAAAVSYGTYFDAVFAGGGVLPAAFAGSAYRLSLLRCRLQPWRLRWL